MKPNITIHQVDPRGPSLTVQLGDGYAAPSVNGGWQDTARPRAGSIAEWNGRALATQDIPIMLDGFENETSVEPAILRLFNWMRLQVGTRDEPPVLKITGVPLPFQNLLWVLNAIAPGEEVRRESDGQRIRAAMTLTFLEYHEGDVVVSRTSSPAKKQRQKSHSSAKSSGASVGTRTYTVRHGDTLSGIASRLLGKASRWHDIAQINHLRDPNRINVGQKLKIPKK